MLAAPLGPAVLAHQPLDAAGILAFATLFALTLVATLRQPSLGIVAIVVTAPFALYRDVGPSELTLPKVAVIAVALGLVARRQWRRPGRAATAIGLGLVAILVATALSIAQAEHHAAALRETLKAAQYLLTFAVVAFAFRADESEAAVRIAVVATSSAVCAIAVSELVRGAPSGLWIAGHAIPRIAGPLEGPNQLAGYLGVTLPLQTAFALRRRPLPLERAALGLGVATLVLTLSRSGVLAALASLVLVVAVSPVARRRFTLTALGTGAAIGAAIVGVMSWSAVHNLSLLGRFASDAEVERAGGVGDRSRLWYAARVLWLQHPLLGIGAGNFELEIPRAGVQGVRTHANSLYVQSLVEGGVPLLAAYLFALGAAAWTLARGPLRDPLVLGALGAVAGLALHQILDLLFFYPKVGIMFWSAVALGAARVDAPLVER